MIRIDTLVHSLIGRCLALLLATAIPLLSCKQGPPPPLAPMSGLRDYQRPAWVSIPGGRVNTAGGNFLVSRVDLSIDTRLGSREVGAVYNSQSGVWTWSFELRYDGAIFVDETEAAFDTTSLPPGAAIPGTDWVVVDGASIKTKGGLLHVFDAQSTGLDHVRWTSSDYPRLQYLRTLVAGEMRVSEVQQCKSSAANCSLLYSVARDSAGRVVGLQDLAGRSTAYSYDGAGQLAAARDALDIERGWAGARYEYLGTRLSAWVNSENERVEYTYQGRRLRTATQVGQVGEVGELGGVQPVSQFVYVGKKNGLYSTRAIDPTGVETVYRYDESRRLFEVESTATGDRVQRTWTGVRPTSVTDAGGATTWWSWTDDDLAIQTQPSGNSVTFVYAAAAVDRERPRRRPIASASDSLGSLESRVYDAAGRLVSRANGAGEITGFTYKSNQMIDTLTRPDGVVVALSSYGDHGHPGTVTTGGLSQTRTFDAVGNRLAGPSEEDEMPGVISRSYDSDRNLSELLVADSGLFGATTSATISFEYRSDHRQTRIARPGGGDHEFVYDALGRAVEMRERVDGVWRSVDIEYDAAGRVVARERENGMRTESDFDAAGRLTTTRALRNGSTENTLDLTYSNGRLSALDDTSRPGTETLVYDASGHLSAVGFPDGEFLAFEHDPRGRRTQDVYYDAALQFVREVRRSYDAADRETSVSDGLESLVERSYLAGRLDEVSYGNGLVRSYAYGSRGELVGTEMRNGSGGLVEQTQIARTTGLNALVYEATTETFGALPVETQEVYHVWPGDPQSDPLGVVGRRVTAWAPVVGGAGEELRTDVLGNRASDFDETFVYNAEANRLLSVENGEGTTDYVYDAAGFVTSRSGVPLTWNAIGKLASHGADTFAWDLLGRPIASTVGGITTRAMWGGRIIASAAGQPLSLGETEWQIDLVAGNHLYRHSDFRDNVKLVSDSGGNVVTHYRYDPYGVDAIFGSGADGVRFVGRSQIGELMILGARIYDPVAGIFLSPDPILHPLNQYAYALGNPVEFQDPDGLASFADFVTVLLLGVGTGLLTGGMITGAGVFVAIGIVFIILAAINNWAAGSALMNPPSSSGGSGDGSSSGSTGGCSVPAALSTGSGAERLLPVLLSAHLAMAILVLRRRRRRRRSVG